MTVCLISCLLILTTGSSSFSSLADVECFTTLSGDDPCNFSGSGASTTSQDSSNLSSRIAVLGPLQLSVNVDSCGSSVSSEADRLLVSRSQLDFLRISFAFSRRFMPFQTQFLHCIGKLTNINTKRASNVTSSSAHQHLRFDVAQASYIAALICTLEMRESTREITRLRKRGL